MDASNKLSTHITNPVKFEGPDKAVNYGTNGPSLTNKSSNLLASFKSEAAVIAPLAKNIAADLNSSSYALAVKSNYSSEKKTEFNHRQEKIETDSLVVAKVNSKTVEVSSKMDEIRQNLQHIDQVMIYKVRKDGEIEFKNVEGMKKKDLKKDESKGWTRTFNTGSQVYLPASAGFAEGHRLSNGQTVVLLTDEEHQELHKILHDFLNDYYISLKPIKDPEKKDDDVKIIETQMASTKAKPLLLVQEKEKYTPKVTDLSNVLGKLQESIQSEDKKHEAYLQYADHADHLKKVILEKSINKENIKSDAIDHAEAQQVEKHSYLTSQSLSNRAIHIPSN